MRLVQPESCCHDGFATYAEQPLPVPFPSVSGNVDVSLQTGPAQRGGAPWWAAATARVASIAPATDMEQPIRDRSPLLCIDARRVDSRSRPPLGLPSVPAVVARVGRPSAVRRTARPTEVNVSLLIRTLFSRLRALTTMTVISAALALLAAIPAHASPGAAPGLSAEQERIVLGLIDSACGDTWCEGDYAFSFRRLSCTWAAHRCSLTLSIAPYADQPMRWHRRTGELRGLRRYSQLVDVAPNGQPSLDPAFSRSLTKLIARIEATVQAVPDH